jgi:catechol 2,3-dioxygenase-like lactoylglutathione lyase family enzyme
MLGMRKLLTRLPAKDLGRARDWYAEKLGLEPAEERPGGLRYVVGACEFALFTSAGASDGSFAQMGVRGRGPRLDGRGEGNCHQGFCVVSICSWLACVELRRRCRD